jgi:hypothetical protein
MFSHSFSRITRHTGLSAVCLTFLISAAVLSAAKPAAAAPEKDSCKVQANRSGTIQQAIDSGCTTIRVQPGTYTENLVISSGATVSINAVSRSGNTVIDGSGDGSVITVRTGAQVTLSGLTIQNGSAVTGGGILNRGSLTLVNTTVTNNLADYAGGGIFNDFGTLTLSDSLVTNNVALNVGGGIFNNQGVVTITDSSVTDNEASFQGGGIYNNRGSVTLTDSLVTGNRAGYNGGGIFNLGGIGTVTLVSTVVTGNFPDDLSN